MNAPYKSATHHHTHRSPSSFMQCCRAMPSHAAESHTQPAWTHRISAVTAHVSTHIISSAAESAGAKRSRPCCARTPHTCKRLAARPCSQNGVGPGRAGWRCSGCALRATTVLWCRSREYRSAAGPHAPVAPRWPAAIGGPASTRVGCTWHGAGLSQSTLDMHGGGRLGPRAQPGAHLARLAAADSQAVVAQCVPRRRPRALRGRRALRAY
jgi:hypothetical protein